MPLSRDLAEESQGSDRKWQDGREAQYQYTYSASREEESVRIADSFLTPFSFPPPRRPAFPAVLYSLRKLPSPCM